MENKNTHIVEDVFKLTYPNYRAAFLKAMSHEHGVSQKAVLEEIGENEMKRYWRQEVTKAARDTQLELPVLKSFARTFGAADYLSTFRGQREQKAAFNLAELANKAIKSPRPLTDAEIAKGRYPGYHELTPEQQWEQDDKLGILDWDGS